MRLWKIYICADCGKDMAAFAGEHIMVDMTAWACRCGGSNFIECTDLQLVPVDKIKNLQASLNYSDDQKPTESYWICLWCLRKNPPTIVICDCMCGNKGEEI